MVGYREKLNLYMYETIKHCLRKTILSGVRLNAVEMTKEKIIFNAGIFCVK